MGGDDCDDGDLVVVYQGMTELTGQRKAEEE
jgi:hypothetical protein